MKKSFYAILFLLFVMCSCSPVKDDYLVYLIKDPSGESQLFFYDPFKDIQVPILSGWKIDTVSLSTKNQLAFSSSHEGNSDVYILNYPFTDNAPVNITHDKSTNNHVFSWVPDGEYLAFKSERDDRKMLSIWDGISVSHIRPYKVNIGELTWSLNNQLAFTEFYTFSFPYDNDPTEIFLWDEDSIINVSQNPSGEDREPNWSKNGQLAFLSNRDGKKYDIFVWDGMSKAKGVPIIELQRNDANIIYYSSPTWTSSGSLTVCATGPEDRHHYAQIYKWSGQTITNISKNPNLHNCGQTWRNDGYWSFATFFSSPLLYIRDNENETQVTIEGLTHLHGVKVVS